MISHDNSNELAAIRKDSYERGLIYNTTAASASFHDISADLLFALSAQKNSHEHFVLWGQHKAVGSGREFGRKRLIILVNTMFYVLCSESHYTFALMHIFIYTSHIYLCCTPIRSHNINFLFTTYNVSFLCTLLSTRLMWLFNSPTTILEKTKPKQKTGQLVHEHPVNCRLLFVSDKQ